MLNSLLPGPFPGFFKLSDLPKTPVPLLTDQNYLPFKKSVSYLLFINLGKVTNKQNHLFDVTVKTCHFFSESL